jgi:hypothetical protein
LLHFAFMQVNARTEHVRKLKFHGRSSKSQVDREEQSGGFGHDLQSVAAGILPAVSGGILAVRPQERSSRP